MSPRHVHVLFLIAALAAVATVGCAEAGAREVRDTGTTVRDLGVVYVDAPRPNISDTYVPPSTDSGRFDAAIAVDSARVDANVIIDAGPTCRADYLEPNESSLAADLRSFGREQTDTVNVTIHANTDQDWYRFGFDDTVWFRPHAIAEIRDAPTDSNLDMTTVWTCNRGGNDSTCMTGVQSDYNQDGIGSGRACASASATSQEQTRTRASCGNGFTNEDGVLHVHVTQARPHNMCFSYTLYVGEFNDNE